jgi:hypothetical protein
MNQLHNARPDVQLDSNRRYGAFHSSSAFVIAQLQAAAATGQSLIGVSDAYQLSQ